MGKKFTLSASDRLKSRKALDLLFSEGNSFVVAPYRVIYRFVPSGLQFTAGVSARNFKKASDRNRIKRQTREAYRLQKTELQDLLQQQQKGLHVFFTYTARDKKEYSLLATALQKSITKLIALAHETNSPAA